MGYCDSFADEGWVESPSILKNAGYKFKWKRRKTKIDGCPCSKCEEILPSGSWMYIQQNRWHGLVVAILCVKCYEKFKS